MTRTCFATAFYHASGKAPNLTTLSERRQLEAYYRCIVVFFATVRRFHWNEELVLFTNREIATGFQRLLEPLGVQTVVLSHADCRYTTDSAVSNSFPGCLFTLDVVDYCAASRDLGQCSSLFLFDSDCVLQRRLDFLVNAVEAEGKASGIRLAYPAEKNVNGQSVSSLSRSYRALDPEVAADFLIDYYGGEFYGLSFATLPVVASEIRRCFEALKAENPEGLICTEEHVLSLVYASLGSGALVPSGKGVKRLWTADNYNNIDGTEGDYAVLHLPAEKGRFFRSAFARLRKDIHCLDTLSERAYGELLSEPIAACAYPSVLRKSRFLLGSALKRMLAAARPG